jgi:OOP family OmpA-OmpF porin
MLVLWSLSLLRAISVRLSGVALALVATAFLTQQPAGAASGWTLDPASSTLTYQSVKKNTIVETNKIRNITGAISPEGDATVEFDLNSVDTGIDLRNVRMRFLFFETFKYPTATLTAKLDPAAFADLPAKRRMTVTLPFALDLHGVKKDLEAQVVVTMLTDSMVSVASQTPISINVDDFGLLPNVEKLQQAANVSSILPTATVTFDFVFAQDGGDPAKPAIVAAAPAEAAAPVEAVAAEPVSAEQPAGPVATDATKDAYSNEECLNRFEVLSRTGSIYFRIASARLDPQSRPVLDAVLDVVTKCPQLKVEVSGHTDSDGDDAANQRLSERRAKSVAEFLVTAGAAQAQIGAVGYGESRPIAANDTDKNKGLNRRIEFSASPMAN